MSEDIAEQAACWHLRQDRDDMDWDGFTAWLEADPHHRRVFDEIALLDDRIVRHRERLREVSVPEPTSVSEPTRQRRRTVLWAASAAAAAVAIMVGIGTVQQTDTSPAPQLYRAGSATRLVNLGGGTQVSLAPGSVLTATGQNPRQLSLSGRAFFNVTYDRSRQLLVDAEGYRIRDVGTQFEVVTGDHMVRVAVAEGRIAVGTRADTPDLQIAAGNSLTAAGGRLTTAAVRPNDIGGWRTGPLVYDGVPIGIVAADVGRASGRRVVVDPLLARRPFTGVLASANGDAMVDVLAKLSGLQARRDGDTIRLGDRGTR